MMIRRRAEGATAEVDGSPEEEVATPLRGGAGGRGKVWERELPRPLLLVALAAGTFGHLALHVSEVWPAVFACPLVCTNLRGGAWSAHLAWSWVRLVLCGALGVLALAEVLLALLEGAGVGWAGEGRACLRGEASWWGSSARGAWERRAAWLARAWARTAPSWARLSVCAAWVVACACFVLRVPLGASLLRRGCAAGGALSLPWEARGGRGGGAAGGAAPWWDVEPSRVAIVSHEEGDAVSPWVQGLVRRVRDEYARRHGYVSVWGPDWFGHASWRKWKLPAELGLAALRNAEHFRRPHWAKVVLLYNLTAHFDYVLWLDADAVIMNPNVTVSDLLRTAAAHHARNLGSNYASPDWDGAPPPTQAPAAASAHAASALAPAAPFDVAVALEEPSQGRGVRNGGVLLVRSAPLARQVLADAWHDGAKHGALPGEQNTLQLHLRRPDVRRRVAAVPPCLFNAWPSSWSWALRFLEGDFVLHVAADTHDGKDARLGVYALQALRTLRGEPWWPVAMPLWTYFA